MEKSTLAIPGDEALYWCDPLIGNRHGIPDRAYVVATTDGGDIEITIHDGQLSIRCNDGYPVVQAQSANVLRVSVQDTW